MVRALAMTATSASMAARSYGSGHVGHLLGVYVTPADEQERAQVQTLCKQLQQATDHTVELAWVDQDYTGEQPATAQILASTGSA